ncbi:MAG: helix-turn-helix transcriptional regulator [Tenericutes bacterium]|nr:helix-turn-helix transcriptional regulator [Mycoplasmatota bacterium]
MKEFCNDVFEDYKLPFATYLAEVIDHENIVHEELEIIWVIKGNAVISCEGIDYLMTAQTVFLVYMYRLHSVKSEEGSIIVSYRLKKEHLHQHNLFFEKVPFKDRVYTFEELAIKYRQVPLLVVQIIKLLLSEEKRDITRYKIIGYYNRYIFDLYHELLKERYLDIKHVNPDEYLNRIHMIVEYTYAHFQEKISLDDLAEITHISRYRVSHFIKEALGISYRDFLQNSRFEQALKLLKETNHSISEISKNSGFSDHKYLNMMLKERFHTTALKYRKSILKKKSCSELSISTYDFIQELKTCIKKIEADKSFQNLIGLESL